MRDTHTIKCYPEYYVVMDHNGICVDGTMASCPDRARDLFLYQTSRWTRWFGSFGRHWRRAETEGYKLRAILIKEAP